MAALRCETGYYDKCQGTWLWCPGRSIPYDRESRREALAPGDHGTTYGGNPFVGAAVDKVLEMMEREHITEHVNRVAPYLEKKLDELVAKHDFLTGRRGLGLMQGVVCEKPVGQIAAKALQAGLNVNKEVSNVLRIVPPLIMV